MDVIENIHIHTLHRQNCLNFYVSMCVCVLIQSYSIKATGHRNKTE